MKNVIALSAIALVLAGCGAKEEVVVEEAPAAEQAPAVEEAAQGETGGVPVDTDAALSAEPVAQ